MKGRLHIVRLVLILSLYVLLSLFGPRGYGNEPEFTEYEIKAAFIFNIAKFVEWPDKVAAENRDTINLCILGTNPFGSALDQIAGKSVKGKKLLVKPITSAKNVKGCNMMFISASERERVTDIVETLKEASVLTIGDTAGYSRHGVIINFYMEGRKVRFETNPDKAKRVGLVISSQLLKLAKIVRSE